MFISQTPSHSFPIKTDSGVQSRKQRDWKERTGWPGVATSQEEGWGLGESLLLALRSGNFGRPSFHGAVGQAVEAKTLILLRTDKELSTLDPLLSS